MKNTYRSTPFFLHPDKSRVGFCRSFRGYFKEGKAANPMGTAAFRITAGGRGVRLRLTLGLSKVVYKCRFFNENLKNPCPALPQ